MIEVFAQCIKSASSEWLLITIKMDFIPKDKILEFKPDTLEYIRKMHNLEKPGEMKEAINILREWVQTQDHFKKKDFSEHYYELSIILNKGSLELAKKRFDKMCTMRTLLPQFFGNYNVKKDFGNVFNSVYTFALPKLKDDHTRVIVTKYHNNPIEPMHFTNYFRYTIILAEYIKAHDYMNKFEVIIDYTDANIGDILKKFSIVELRQIMSIYAEAYIMRTQAIHVVSSSKLIDTIVAIIKQVVSPKINDRIHIHKTIEGVHEYIPKSILPKDYGGEERSLKELQTEWINVLSSEDNMKYIRDIGEAGTDESRRQIDDFNEHYAGMPGTFRVLTVD